MSLQHCFAQVRHALAELAPEIKCSLVAQLEFPSGDFSAACSDLDFAGIPGRPLKPELLNPREVPKRGLGTVNGRAALTHAVAHIEFNAINLALDACWRFREMPAAYYRDWLSVAQDEARHFLMLNQRLTELGFTYGDFPAHNGLWEAAEKTAHDVLTRMALVPRVLEARGLDVTPGIILRLQEVGDQESVRILRIILAEEVRHVAIGTYWYRWLCDQRGLHADTVFKNLLTQYNMRLRPPLNLPARMTAGFRESELVGAD